jgi:hypothetical protein
LKFIQTVKKTNPTANETGPSALEREVIKTTEREFKLKHYHSIADRRNRPGLAKFLASEESGAPHKWTVEEVEVEMKKIEEEDLERKKHPEFQEWQRMTNLVLEHYRANAETPEGEKRKYTVLVFGLGGGMRGPYGAGQVAGLNEVGLTADKADVLAGISAGAADLAYYAGGRDQTLKGSAIYYHQCAGSDFLNLLRLNHVMDATVVGDAMREGKQALDTSAVREGPEFSLCGSYTAKRPSCKNGIY